MDKAKLQVPGWRIEQRFNNKVLIGNWNEEIRKVRFLDGDGFSFFKDKFLLIMKQVT